MSSRLPLKPESAHANALPVRLRLLLGALLIAGVIVAFEPATGGGFLNWDDDRNFVENEAYRGAWPGEWHWAWTTYHLGVWQPAAWMLLGVEHAVFGLNPAGYHWVSLLLHALNAVLIFLSTLALLRFDSSRPRTLRFDEVFAFCAALLFGLHPLRVEAVAWVSCQPYLPAIACFLIAVLVYLRGFGGERFRPWRTLTWTFVLYAIAVLFKAVAVTLPVVLLLLDVFPLRRWNGRTRCATKLLMEKLPFFVLAAFVSYQAMAAKDFTQSRAPFHECYPLERLAHAALGVWFYLGKTAWPADLIAFYRLPIGVTIRNPVAIAAATGLVVITGIMFLMRKRLPALLAGWIAYLLILLPNTGLIQISQQLAADRYGYLSTVGLFVLLALGTCRINQRSKPLGRAIMLIAVCLAAVLGVRTRSQCLMWKDSETLWRATLKCDADCAVARCNLGECLVKQGRYAEASEQLSRAIDIDPRFAFAYANLGVVLCQARRFDQAAQFGEKALSVEPGLAGLDRARAHAMLGQAYAGMRRDDDAWRQTRAAERLGLSEARKMIDYLSKISKEPVDSATRPVTNGR